MYLGQEAEINWRTPEEKITVWGVPKGTSMQDILEKLSPVAQAAGEIAKQYFTYKTQKQVLKATGQLPLPTGGPGFISPRGFGGMDMTTMMLIGGGALLLIVLLKRRT